MSGAQALSSEMQFAVDRLVAKVFQGDEGKRGLATNCVSVVFGALQDHTARTIGTLDEGELAEVGIELDRIGARDVEDIRRLMELRVRGRDASVALMEDEI